MPKLAAAALLVLALAFTLAPARAADTATADDTAHFLAGLPPATGSALAALTSDARWQRHARYFDAIFEREDATTLSRVRAFAREHLADKHDTMLYMFSGPDFLYATSFFPNASTYVLAGLEPVGDVSQSDGAEASFSRLHTAEHREFDRHAHELQFLHHQEHEDATVERADLRDAADPLCVPGAHRKDRPRATFVDLDGDGNVQTRNETGGKRGNSSAASGVRIVFSAGNGPQQTLYYFSTNLADGGVTRSGFLGLLRQARCRRQLHQERFLPSARRQLHESAQLPARSQRHDPAGRQRHPARLFRSEEVAAAAVRPLRAAAFDLPRAYQPRMGELFRKSTPIEFGTRLPLAQE